MEKVTIGTVGKTLANAGICTWQIPSGFSGGKIAGGTLGSGALKDGVINVRHMQAESVNADALQAACVTAVKIAAGAVTADKLDANTVDAKIANLVVANITNANIEWAEIEKLNAAIAEISKAHLVDADIEWAKIANLTAQVASIAQAKIENATITTAQIDNLSAAVAEIVHLQAKIGDFTLTEVKNLLANALILQEGLADNMMIKNLVVTSANLLCATVDQLVVKGADGKYYRIQIDSDGAISTEEVTVTDDELAAGETNDGRQIVASTANIGSLNATTVKASQAILATIFTESLDAGVITAGEALIASAKIPTLYVTALNAIGGSIKNWFTIYSNPNIERATAETYQRQLACHIYPRLGEMDIEDVTTDHIQALFNGMNAAKASKDKTRMVLNMVFETALDEGIIAKNPMKSRRLRITGRASEPTEEYSIEQMRYLVRHIPSVADETDRAYLALQALHPLRLEEVLGLKWEDVDREHMRLHICRAVTHPTRNMPEVKMPKTKASIRTIGLSRIALEFLGEGKPDEFVIGGEKPFSYTQVRRMCERIRRDTGFQDRITPIRFRTTVLTDIYDQTKDIKQAQAAAGHTTAAMTLKYYVKGRSGTHEATSAVERAYGIG